MRNAALGFGEHTLLRPAIGFFELVLEMLLRISLRARRELRIALTDSDGLAIEIGFAIDARVNGAAPNYETRC